MPYEKISDIINLPEEIQNMDFSCIVLEYYLSLEQLANILLFRPYRDKILQAKYNNCPSYQFHSYMFGYVGNLKENRLSDIAHHRIKDSLEFGNLAFLYKDSLDENENVKNEFLYVESYINALSLNMVKARDFGRKIYDIREFRNEAAHGGNVLDIKKARKARDTVHIRTSDSEVLCLANSEEQCYGIIVDLLKWFAKI